MWNLMDTPMEEQQVFQNVTSNIAASEPEITETNMLSVNFLNNVCNFRVRLLGVENYLYFLMIYNICKGYVGNWHVFNYF